MNSPAFNNSSKPHSRRSLLVGAMALTLVAGLLTIAAWLTPLDERESLSWPVSDLELNRRVLGPLVKDVTASMRFRARVEGLSGIRVVFATYLRSNASTLRVQIKDVARGRIVASRDVPAASIKDWSWHSWQFKTQDDSRGREYELTWFSPDADDKSCLAFVGVRSLDDSVRLVFNGTEMAETAPPLQLVYSLRPVWWASRSFWLAALVGALVWLVIRPAVTLRQSPLKVMRRGLAPAMLVLASCLLTLAMGEVVLRFLRPEYQYAARSQQVRSESRGFENPRSFCRARGHPDVPGMEFPLLFNSLGLRQHREFTPLKPRDVIRIGFFGDSFTANTRAEAQYSFTEPLDYLLNRTGRRFEVLNFGVDGYGTDQVYLQLLQDGLNLGLDYVFYDFCFNDLTDTMSRNLLEVDARGRVAPTGQSAGRGWTDWVQGYYLTYLVNSFISGYSPDIAYRRRLADRENAPGGIKVDGAILADFQANRISPALERAIDKVTAIVQEMRLATEASGAKYFVVTLPKYNESNLEPFLKKRGVPYVSLAREFQEKFGRAENYCFKNDAHWNEEGNKLAAIMMFRFLARQVNLPGVDERFIEQGLHEYYSAFGFARVTSRLTADHGQAAPLRPQQIRQRYTGLEEKFPSCSPLRRP